MKKNYRKIPQFIENKLGTIGTTEVEVCAILKIKENELLNPQYANLGLCLIDGVLMYKDCFVPKSESGSYSRKNIDGYRIKYPNKPKVKKTIYYGEHPYFGDWSKGSFPLYVDRIVTAYDNIPPRELAIVVSTIDTKGDAGNRTFTLKVGIDAVYNKEQTHFEKELFFAINLLQENIYVSDVFSAGSTREDYLKTQFVNWDIFPPGSRDDDLLRIIGPRKDVSAELVKRVEDRYGFLMKLNPKEIIQGTSGMRNYFGAKFNDHLVVFENRDYGNAMYLLFEDWESLSKLSRAEIQNRSDDEYIRIPHGKHWKRDVEAVIKDKLRN